MPNLSSSPNLIAGRLSLDFANVIATSPELSWQDLLHFLLVTRIISPERSAQLLALPQNDPQSATALLAKAQTLHASLRKIFSAMLAKEALLRDWVAPINEVLRTTEGHD